MLANLLDMHIFCTTSWYGKKWQFHRGFVNACYIHLSLMHAAVTESFIWSHWATGLGPWIGAPTCFPLVWTHLDAGLQV
jgi:hypothetical protein